MCFWLVFEVWSLPWEALGSSYRVMFCDFFMDLSTKTPTCESISGRTSSNKTINSRCFRLENHEKVKQTSRRRVTRVTKYCTKQHSYTIWNSSPDPPDPPDPADQVSGAAARNHPSTRAGAQDDVSYKKIPQISHYCLFYMSCFKDERVPVRASCVLIVC